MIAIHAAKSGKTSEAHHHISTALWLLEQYDAPAGELNKLRVWAHERTSTVGGGSTDAPKKVDGGPKKVDGGEADQEEQEKKVDGGPKKVDGGPKKVDGGEADQEEQEKKVDSGEEEDNESAWRPQGKYFSLEEVIAWTTKRFEAVMSIEEKGAQAAGKIEGQKFAWFGNESLLDMPVEILPMVSSKLGPNGHGHNGSYDCVANTDALCNYMSQNRIDNWKFYLEVAVDVVDPALIRAIFLNWKRKWMDWCDMEIREAAEWGRCRSFIYRLFESAEDPLYMECIEVIMDLSLEVKLLGQLFLTGADPWTGGTTLHLAVKAGTKKWIEACVKAGVNPLRINFSGKSAAAMTDDAKVKKFLDITVRAKEEADTSEDEG